MAQSILANHYIGSGVKQPLDRTFSIHLCNKDSQIVFVSHDGYMLRLELSKVSASSEEVIRLGVSDYLVNTFLFNPGKVILVMTQAGKAIQLTDDRIELASSLKTKGQSILSPQRREKGARIMWAGLVSEDDWSVVLYQDGQIGLSSVKEILDSGLVSQDSQILAFTTIPSQIEKHNESGIIE